MQAIGFHNTDNPQVTPTPWTKDYRQGATIFGEQTFLPIDYHQARNDNTLVVGSSGTGKTYSFVEPNVLSANANYVVADAKGDILADTGMSLRAQGYQLQVLNLVDLKHSQTYNPLHYMHDQLDVVAFAHQVIGADITGNDDHRSFDDPFWTNAPATLLEALIMFTKEFLPTAEQTMGTVTRLFELIDRTDEDVNAVLASLGYSAATQYAFDHDQDEYGNALPVSLGERLFAWVAGEKPDSVALRLWNSVARSKGSEKTWSSIVGILGTALSPYMVADVDNLLASNQLDFARLLQPKAALFVLYDDADPAKNFLANVLYNQLFSFLYHHAFHQPAGRLPIKVRFFLDDFKNIQVPHFDDYLATARSWNLSLCMMVQDESQLRGLSDDGDDRPDDGQGCGRPLQPRRPLGATTFLVDVSGHLTATRRYDFHDHPNYRPGKLAVAATYQTPRAATNREALVQILQQLPGEHPVTRGDEAVDLFDGLDDLPM
ncbi:type IV secretory system conjugative DNA transfer family protein [Limosilactobacillus pontis]|uniref:Type IV secretory system conjugative DNA transfer family protein n=1 Tax=Limosilactobacillus pontis TaxID=35787 RepID=A0ABU7SQY8_9LACO